jgi:hypothetical protein
MHTGITRLSRSSSREPLGQLNEEAAIRRGHDLRECHHQPEALDDTQINLVFLKQLQ